MTTWEPEGQCPRRVRWWLLRAALELALLAALWVVYDAGRMIMLGQEPEAREHAQLVRDLERFLHLPSEAAIQGALHGLPRAYELANTWYVSMHFPVTIAFLVFGFAFRPREQYLWARNLLIVQTLLALVVHLVFPLAPPRMFHEWGFVDTMARYGPNAYSGASGAVANQFAAMPSLHVGWALLIAVVLARTGPRWLAVVGALYCATTAAVVVVTANHWWLDGAVAAALLGVGLVLFPEPGRTRLRLPTALLRQIGRSGAVRAGDSQRPWPGDDRVSDGIVDDLLDGSNSTALDTRRSTTTLR